MCKQMPLLFSPIAKPKPLQTPDCVRSFKVGIESAVPAAFQRKLLEQPGQSRVESCNPRVSLETDMKTIGLIHGVLLLEIDEPC